MGKKLTKVEFVLENCDAVEIDAQHIGNFYVGDLKRNIHKHDRHVTHNTICKQFSIYINRNADEKHYQLEMELEEYATTKLKRLQEGCDIVSIYLHYDDESSDYFYVDWLGDSDYSNEAQRVSRNSEGDMLIIIDENKDDDLWRIDRLNDIASMNLMWKFNK